MLFPKHPCPQKSSGGNLLGAGRKDFKSFESFVKQRRQHAASVSSPREQTKYLQNLIKFILFKL